MKMDTVIYCFAIAWLIFTVGSIILSRKIDGYLPELDGIVVALVGGPLVFVHLLKQVLKVYFRNYRGLKQ